MTKTKTQINPSSSIPFMDDDFLLFTDTAKHLYHGHASDQPIYDYHNHLSPKDIAENRQFSNLTEIWLDGDHYKWRSMRLNGEAETYCTGDADPYDKFLAFARTVPYTLRNPLYHWTHLELQRYFDIHEALSEATAPMIWERANEKLADPEYSIWSFFKRFNIKLVGTTDDPTDSLEHHIKLQDSDCPAQIVPTFRPDNAMKLDDLGAWNTWVDGLEKASQTDCRSYKSFIGTLELRHDAFAQLGCRSSDHGLQQCPRLIYSETEAQKAFDKARNFEHLSKDDQDGLAGAILAFVAQLNHDKGWVMQLHLGPMRNVNKGLYKTLGPDIGCDSIGDDAQAERLGAFLSTLSDRDHLPRTILYNLNPSQNYVFASMCGNFFEEGIPSKVQFGSGWWFLDQLDGMRAQIDTLSNLGLLRNFIGMLTDSRSFMSFPRHEYFRRLLCQIIGDDVEKGLLPDDIPQLGQMIEDICSNNVKTYFGF